MTIHQTARQPENEFTLIAHDESYTFEERIRQINLDFPAFNEYLAAAKLQFTKKWCTKEGYE